MRSRRSPSNLRCTSRPPTRRERPLVNAGRYAAE